MPFTKVGPQWPENRFQTHGAACVRLMGQDASASGVVEDYRNGLTIHAIAMRYKMGWKRVRAILTENGIVPTPNNRYRPEDAAQSTARETIGTRAEG